MNQPQIYRRFAIYGRMLRAIAVWSWVVLGYSIFLTNYGYSQNQINLDSLRIESQKGNSESSLRLVEWFSYENADTTDKDSIQKYLKIAANQNDSTGLYLYGVSLARGLYGKRDPKQAVLYLNKAADKNHPLAIRVLMELYSEKPDPFLSPNERVKLDSTKALQYAIRGAKLYDTPCLMHAAHAYHTGGGTKRNDTLAVAWLDTAATHNRYILAQLKMGDWFLANETVFGVDWNRAKKYYAMASENPIAEHEHNVLGKIGVHEATQNPKRLLNWYFKICSVLWSEVPLYSVQYRR